MTDPRQPDRSEQHGDYAAVIIDTYDDPRLRTLERLRNEVSEVAKLLCARGFTEEHHDLVGDGTALSLRQGLSQWRPRARRLLLYWAGHGEPVGDGDVWLHGRDGGPTPAITLTGRDLGRLLADKAVDETVLIVDACQAGVAAHVITSAFDSARARTRRPGPLQPSLAVISSAGPGELAREGVFAPALIHVLREGPPDDQSRLWWTEHDQYIFPDELAAAVRVVLHQQDARQLPDHHMVGSVIRFFPNPRHRPFAPDVEVEAKRRRGAWLPADVREHFMVKFRGIDTADERGWYFTGRTQPLREIVDWLRTARSGLLVVAGPPGCGKSATLGRLAILSDPDYRAEAQQAGVLTGLQEATDPGLESIDAGIHAKNKTLLDCVGELAAALDLPAPARGWQSAGELVDAVRDRGQPGTVLLDALDEAHAADQAAIAGDLLRGLASLPQVRVLVGTRPDRARADQPLPGARDGDGPLLRALAADHVVWLERDLGAKAAIADYMTRRLRETPGSPYTDQPEQTGRAAAEVATYSGGIFLFARLLARALARNDQPLDLTSKQAQQLLRGGVAEAFAADLARYGPDRQRVRDLLTPLAWAEGAGLPRRQVWLAVANALAGRGYTEADLAWVLDHAGAHLIEAGEDGQTVYRLYHQAFNDYLRREHDERAVQGKVTDALLALAGSDVARDWAGANPYLLRHLGAHAAAAGRLAELVDDARYLLYADPQRLARVLGSVDHHQHVLTRLYWRSLDRLRDATPTQRAATLQITALNHEPTALPLINTEAELPWRGLWAAGPPTPFHRRLTGHTSRVREVALAQVADRAVIVTAGDDHTVRVWDAETGEPQATLIGYMRRVWAVAVGQVAGRAVIVTGGGDKRVRVWDAETGELRATLTGHTSRVWAVGFGQVADRAVIVSGGDDHTVRVWDAETGELRATLTGHTSRVWAVGFGQVAGRAVIVSGGRNGRVRVWDAKTGKRQATRTHLGGMRAVAVGQVAGRTVIVIGGDDKKVRVWDVETGESRATRAHPGGVLAVAVGQVAGRAVIVSSGGDKRVRVWDAETEEPRATWTSRTGSVLAVAVGQVGGRAVIVSGGADKTVRVWDVETGMPPAASTSLTGGVSTVAVGQVAGRTVIVSGGGGGTVRAWDAETGEPRATLTGHIGSVLAVAVGQVAGRTVIVSGGRDGTVRVWDAKTGKLRVNLIGHTSRVWAVAVGQVAGRAVIVSAGDDHTVRVWDAETGERRATLTSRTGSVLTVAVGQVAGRAVIVSAHGGGVRVWDAETGKPRVNLIGHTSRVWAVAVGQVAGRAVIVSAGDDHTVRVWDAETGVPRATLTSNFGDVRAVAVGQVAGRAVIVSAHGGGVRVWDTETGKPRATLAHLAGVHMVALAQMDRRTLVVVGGNSRVAVVELLRLPE